jgi:hypothetical protein
MIDSIFEKAKRLKPGAVIISLKQPTIGFSFCQVNEEDPCLRSSDGFFNFVKEEWYLYIFTLFPFYF